jgi:hypothetical protein
VSGRDAATCSTLYARKGGVHAAVPHRVVHTRRPAISPRWHEAELGARLAVERAMLSVAMLSKAMVSEAMVGVELGARQV